MDTTKALDALAEAHECLGYCHRAIIDAAAGLKSIQASVRRQTEMSGQWQWRIDELQLGVRRVVVEAASDLAFAFAQQLNNELAAIRKSVRQLEDFEAEGSIHVLAGLLDELDEAIESVGKALPEPPTTKIGKE